MKRFLVGLLVITPLAILGFFTFVPEADGTANLPLFHFYIVTFTTFAAVVLSILLTYALGEGAQVRHIIAAVAFAAMGAIFFSHGVTTPGALIAHFHPAVTWSSWLTLFAGGLLFAIASADHPRHTPRWLSVRRVVYGTLIGVAAYMALATFYPQGLTYIEARAAPWHRAIIAILTMILWLTAGWRLGQIWRVTGNRVDGTLAFVALWMVQATISMHEFETWQYSWWLYHFLLLAGFLIAAYILMSAYEQTRQFRLLPYYVAGSLIAIAFLALVASDLFARFSYNTAVAQLTTTATETINNLTRTISQSLPAEATPADLRDALQTHLPSSPSTYFRAYDENGELLYPNASATYPSAVTGDILPAYARALEGDVVVNVHDDSEEASAGYIADEAGYLVATFAPIYADLNGRPVGVIQMINPAPQLTAVVLRSRNAGLGIAALTMTLLFVALFFVVRRANGIIVHRTEELEEAYANLMRAENMRDDLTHMIVHDMRNPLTSISASLDLLHMGENQEAPPQREHFIKTARNGAQRLQNLIDDILTVSKLESGELTLELHPTPVDQLLVGHAQNFAVRASAEDKRLEVEAPPDLAWRLDADLIGRVLENLLSNAFKYTLGGEGEIQMTARSQNGKIYFHVRDNGDGIPDAYKKHIFDKYRQVPNGAGEALRKGTGLGLTFCRMVVEAHGGEIYVEDAPEGGSRFIFWLPPQPDGQ